MNVYIQSIIRTKYKPVGQLCSLRIVSSGQKSTTGKHKKGKQNYIKKLNLNSNAKYSL